MIHLDILHRASYQKFFHFFKGVTFHNLVIGTFAFGEVLATNLMNIFSCLSTLIIAAL